MMPSTEEVEAQNSKESNEKEFDNNYEPASTDVPSHSRESTANRSSRVSGLSNKIKRETIKLFGYPGKAMKRTAASNEFNTADNEIQNLEDKTDNARIHEDFSSYFKEHDILMEFKYLCKNPPGGVYVIPSIKSLQVWHGIIFLRAGPFREGVFRFDILFQDNFPNAAPLIRFTSHVFHPQIHKNGILNIEQAFPRWNKHENHIGDLLKYLKSSFYTMNTGRPLNEEAANCLNENLEDFKSRARSCVKQSLEEFEKESLVTSDDDGNLLKVRNFSALAIEEWKQKLLCKDHLDTDVL
ncbi:AKT-interacting protein-like [Dendronephthya gigantea]|uniref:AKT-interacting protein-like n=1 Tax=Dendronephthya gigantea TaxID=151771 RepID=UPI00106A2052|nr:AKT-interacting protein-like [Dendronephthya gigantea]